VRVRRRLRGVETFSRGTLSALSSKERIDAVGLASATLRSTRTLDLDDGETGALQVPTKAGAPAAGAPAAGALDAEDEPLRLAQALGPALQLSGADHARRERELAQ
jgi:hypothetical protein